MANANKKPEGLYENAVVMVQAILIAVFIRTILIQPFVIPSGSMKSTLLVGDYLMTTKWSYGYSRYSIPFSPPLFKGRIFGSDPQRGDVAVFRPPNHDIDNDYIKRVVGIPGDKVAMKSGNLFINGQQIKIERIGTFQDETDSGYVVQRPHFKETLPNGVTHEMLKNFDRPTDLDTMYETEIPKGHFFMMGDNRDASADSRVFGPVPLENFVGKAQIIFFSVNQGEAAWTFWRWPWSVRFSRLLNLIR